MGSINTEYQEASLDTDGFTAKMVDQINNKMAAADDDATNSVTNVATDTGGIAGRSSGMILTSVNTGTVGYEHVGSAADHAQWQSLGIGFLNGLDDADARGRLQESGDRTAHADGGEICKTSHNAPE